MLFPAGSLAEVQVNPGEQSVLTTPDNQSSPLNAGAEQLNEAVAEIETLEQLPEVNSNENLDQQIIVVYANSGEDNVKDLALTTEEVVSGEQLSNRVDLIEVSEGTN